MQELAKPHFPNNLHPLERLEDEGRLVLHPVLKLSSIAKAAKLTVQTRSMVRSTNDLTPEANNLKQISMRRTSNPN